MAGKTVRMLFIGNSFTTKNDLPGLLSVIAKAGKGIIIEYKVISAGGASLRRHWNGGAANTITSGKWDYVVFQEQSTLPVKNANRFHENVREFVPAMKESGAKIVHDLGTKKGTGESEITDRRLQQNRNGAWGDGRPSGYCLAESARQTRRTGVTR